MQATASNDASIAECAGVSPLEPDPVGHSEVSGLVPAAGTKTSPMSTPRPRIPCRWAQVQSISPPAGQVEQAHVPPPLAQLAQQFQLPSVNGLRIRWPASAISCWRSKSMDLRLPWGPREPAAAQTHSLSLTVCPATRFPGP